MRSPADPLAGLRIFQGLDAAERMHVAAHLRRLHLHAGEPLIRAGDEADALYVVIFGRFAVYRGNDTVPVDEISTGETIGETGFFARERRGATVIPTRDSEVLAISRADFEALSTTYPVLAQAAITTLACRLHAMTSRVAPAPTRAGRVVFVCGADDRPIPTGFTRRVAAALTPFTRVRVLGPDKALEQSGAENLHGPEIGRWLHQRESTGAFLLLRASTDDPAWNALAARQADSVLIVARGPHTGRIGSHEALALESTPPEKRRLVLMPDAGPAGPWLASRMAGSHHFLNGPEDYRAIGRFLVGQARGLVLGGGGALCGAHVGTVFALYEAGLRFEAFGGSSAGGAIGAALAMGFDRPEIIATVKDMFLSAKSFSKYTIPRHSLIDPATLDAKFLEHYGTRPVEDLPKPFFTIASDLSTNGALMIERGPLWEAVRATCSIPGVLPPFIDGEGRMLIDGGVVDNLPLRPMQGMKRGPNLVITLSLPQPTRSTARYEHYPPRGRLLAETVMPWMKRERDGLPPLWDTLARSILLSANAGTADSFAAAEMALAPPIAKTIGLLDWKAFETLEQESYDWARRKLDEDPPETLGLFTEGTL